MSSSTYIYSSTSSTTFHVSDEHSADAQFTTRLTRTVMSQLELRFSPSTEQDSGTFRLIELVPELCKLIDSAAETKTTQPM